MNLKNLLWISVIFSSCSVTYNPEGFTCTVSDFRFSGFPFNVAIKMTNPPLYIYQWDWIKGELTDTKIYLKSFEFCLERGSNNIDSIKYAIGSAHMSSNVEVNNVRFHRLRYADDFTIVRPDNSYTMTISISDLFSSSVFADFPIGYGGHVHFVWYDALQLIVEMINSLSEAKYGPKIFIDEYLLQ